MWTRIPSSSVRVTGEDRLDFVQGQMTGDLRGAPSPGMVACAFLNVRGQIEQFARAYRRADDIYLHLDEGQAGALLARLQRYIIFDQVCLQDLTNTLRTIHVWEQGQTPGWTVDGPDAQQYQLNGARVLGGRVNRTGQDGVDLHYLTLEEEQVLQALTGTELSLMDLHQARIEAGIPDVVSDHFAGVLLQEVGLDIGGPLPAISYRKGCYVGQEIMARLEARGNTRYHLARLVGEQLLSHAEVTHEDKVIGQSGLSSGTTCLARLRKELTAGAQVAVNGVPATVQLLPPAHA